MVPILWILAYYIKGKYRSCYGVHSFTYEKTKNFPFFDAITWGFQGLCLGFITGGGLWVEKKWSGRILC